MYKAIICLFLVQQLCAQVPTASLLAYYPLNGNTNDVSINGYTATGVNLVSTTNRYGASGQAYQLTGNGSYISLPAAPFIGLDEYSYSVWIKASSLSANSSFIYGLGGISSTQCQALALQPAGGLFAGSYNIGLSPAQSYVNSPVVPLNQWLHIVVTRDNTNLCMYINGSIISTLTGTTNGQSANYGTGTMGVVFGNRSSLSALNYFNGALDDIRIYARALTPNEVYLLYTEPGCYAFVPNSAPTGTQACVGSVVTLTSSVSNATLQWYSTATATQALGAGTVYTTPQLSSAGVYTFFLEANSCPNARTPITIQVNGNPTISVNSGSVCLGNSFTLSPQGAQSYSYSSGSSIVLPLVNSNYTVTGINNNGCASSAIASVQVQQSPQVFIAGNNTLCAGTAATLTANGANSYSWNTGAFASSVAISPSTTTVYIVTGYAVNGCSAVAGLNVSVYPLPSITITGPSTTCAGSPVTFSASGNGLSYNWSSGAIGNLSTYTALSSQIITASATAQNGCINSNSLTLTVFNLPTLTINSGLAQVCEGSGFVLNCSGASTYTWNAGIANGSTIYPTASSVYSIVGAIPQGCSATAQFSLTVFPRPVISITNSSSTLICAGEQLSLTANGGVTYTWTTGETTPNIFIIPYSSTVVTLLGTDNNGCSNSTSLSLSTDNCTNISDTRRYALQVKTFPNPVNTSLSVVLNQPFLNSNILLSDLSGRIVFNQKIDDTFFKIDLSEFVCGTYLLYIQSDSGQLLHRSLVVKSNY